MVKFHFRGLMCPVFTPFTNDKRNIHYEAIDKYGLLLKQKGIHGILVNGTTGEGTTLRLDERKRLAEEWMKASRKHGLTMMLAIGGSSIADVYDLCEHAKKLGVDAIALLPDLFYKPKIEEDLVDYLKDVTKHCPTRPIYYYHIPEYTGVRLNLLRLHELSQRSLPKWNGIYYRHTNLELLHDLLKEGLNTIVCADTTLTSALILGADAISSIALNLFPENVTEIYDLMHNAKLREARELNDKLYHRLNEIISNPNADWIEAMKLEFNKKTDFNLGTFRKPRTTWNWSRHH